MREPKPFFRKQTQSWYVRLGKQFIPLGKDKEAAFEKYHAIMAKRRKETPVSTDSVRKLLDLYWNWLINNRAETTSDRRKPRLKSFGLFVSPKLTIRQLKPHHVQSWMDQEFAGCSDTTKHTLITTINVAMNWAVEQGYIDSNPLKRMRKPRPQVRQEFVPEALWPDIIKVASPDQFRDFVKVMLSAGSRPEEMFKVEARHFDPEHRRLALEIKDSKGRRRSRVIYLPDVAHEVVARLAKRYPEGPLFRNSVGNPWNKDSIADAFDRVKAKLKMQRLCATMMRHSFAHQRLTNGQDTHIVSKLMGHVDGRMLETRYGHLDQNSEFMHAEANRIGFPSIQGETEPATPSNPV